MDRERMCIFPEEMFSSVSVCEFVGAGWGAGKASLFMLRDDKLQELNYFKQRMTSWFVGERVVQGTLFRSSLSRSPGL